ncbi:MAG: sulfite exporter TauE/SafE family protein [Opitutales bacterium]
MTADVDSLSNGFAAVVAGLIASPHCLLMCGPLSCSMLGGPKVSEEQAFVGRALYHTARVISYGIIGAISGLLGYTLARSLAWDIAQVFPWFVVGFLAFFAAGIHRKLPKPVWLTRFAMQATQKTKDKNAWVRGTALGIVTPLLPCGPLYAVFWLAMLSGSPVYGLEIGVGFGIGTIALLWVGQSQFQKLRTKLGQNWVSHLQRGVAAFAALVIAMRASDLSPQRIAEMCGF